MKDYQFSWIQRIKLALIVISITNSQLTTALTQTTNRYQPLIAYADPLVGTENGGNIVPGAQLPFGFVHVSPDTLNPNTAGYNSSENIIGFSQTHVSGTGGGHANREFSPHPFCRRVGGHN